MSDNEDNEDMTLDDVRASREFEVAVQCGICYTWYDCFKTDHCPNCGATEIVGDR